MSSLTLTILTGLLFGGSTLFAKAAGVSPNQTAIMVCIGTAMAGMLLFILNGGLGAMTPTSALLALVSGLANGAGVLLFYRMIGTKGVGSFDLSSLIPLTSVIMFSVSAVGGFALYGEKLSPQKAAGLACAAAAIWFLR